MPDLINIDDHIDWKNFYFTYLPTLKLKGNELTGLCPFHNERNPSFGVNIKNGKYKCLSCGASGNAWNFLMQIEGKTKQEATESIYRFAGLEPPSAQTNTRTPASKSRSKFTVEMYAEAKKLDVQLLHDCGLKNSSKGVVIPYLDKQGSITATRYRHTTSGALKFTWMKGAKIGLYGLWRLQEAKQAGYVVLVEGESDSHTLWQHGIPALGVPGADTFKAAWVKSLEGLKIYLSKEPDQGGETFLKKTCEELLRGRFGGEVYQISLGEHKDPSGLHLAGDFDAKWAAAFKNASRVDIRVAAKIAEKVIDDQPFTPIRPDGYRYSEDGVWETDERGGERNISPIPVILTRRLLNVETETEKLELAFRKDGKWRKINVEKTTVYQRSKIAELSATGLMVTSETGKSMVNYLFAMESANIDFLPTARSISHLGWIDKQRFLPHHAEGIVLDMEEKREMRNMVHSFRSGGSYDAWKLCMEYIIKHPLPQIMLAASFASPLLSIVGHRNFITHVWGASKGGKTAAMKAALSVWGEPEKIMATFNTTMVGLERMCGFLCNLPLGVDERQLAGNKQEFLDKLVYAVSAGQGKMRGKKDGGLQATSYWNLIIMTTGEEALSGDASHGGVKTRALELYGVPLPDQQEAQKIHIAVDQNYGHAGKEFMAKVIEQHAKDKDFFQKEYAGVFAQLQRSFSQIAQPHLSALAICCVAYYYARQWIWGLDEAVAMEEMRQMAVTSVDILSDAQEEDYTDRAWDFTLSWLLSNSERFKEDVHQESYGRYDAMSMQYWVVPKIYKDALQDAGFSASRVLKEFAEKKYIESEKNRGQTTPSVRKLWRDVRCRMIVFNVSGQENLCMDR